MRSSHGACHALLYVDDSDEEEEEETTDDDEEDTEDVDEEDVETDDAEDELLEDDASSAKLSVGAEANSIAPAATAARERFIRGRERICSTLYQRRPNAELRRFRFGALYISFDAPARRSAGLVYDRGVHVRYTMSVGMPVMDDRSDDVVATVSGVFIHPDLGKLEGVFVRGSAGEEFLSVQDIVHWGKAVMVRDSDVLAPLDERVRLSQLWAEGRSVLGQRIVTESGRVIGRCADVQFETDTFRLEWIFPRHWLRWKRPIPASSIVEVRTEAICVREAEVPVAEGGALGALETTAVQG